MLKSKKKNDITTFYNSSNGETLLALAPYFHDDFNGPALNTFNWTALDAGAATEAIVSGENGVLALTLTSEDLDQTAGIYFGDICPFRLDRHPIFEARVRWTVDLLGAEGSATAVIGMANATGAIDAITDSCWFRFDGNTGLL